MLDATDELCQLWSYAEDLETFEYGNKVLLDQNAGPVSLPDYPPTQSSSLCSKYAHPDLQDEVQ